MKAHYQKLKSMLDKEMGIHNESEKSLTVDAEMQLDDTFKNNMLNQYWTKLTRLNLINRIRRK